MEIQQAIDIVSYKLALKNAASAQADNVLNQTQVEKAIADKESGNEQKVDLKLYMQATKMVKQHRIDLYKQENEAFLDSIQLNEDVKALDSGLLYHILDEGSGESPALSDTVKVDYTGTLTCEKVFDSTAERGQPAIFSLNKVIQAWQQGLPLIKEGGCIRLYSPQELGYADQGFGSKVPPFSTLIFEITLLEIVI